MSLEEGTVSNLCRACRLGGGFADPTWVRLGHRYFAGNPEKAKVDSRLLLAGMTHYLYLPFAPPYKGVGGVGGNSSFRFSPVLIG